MTVRTPAPTVDDQTFLENVREARENGFDLVCSECGAGMSGDGMDIHEPGLNFRGVRSGACSQFTEGSLR